MSDHKRGQAGSGRHTPRKGEQAQAKEHDHVDAGEHAKTTEKVHHDTVPDAAGTAKYPN